MRPDISSATAAPGHAAHDDDAAVIARSLSDPEQFALLFRRHAPVIQRYVTRRIGPQPADDVVAETFLVAFRRRAAYRLDQRDCLPWLYGIATNLVGRHRRSEVTHLRLLARTGVDPVTEPFTDQVDAAVTAGSSKARLAAALASLPAEGQVLGWGALLATAIVQRPGQLPSCWPGPGPEVSTADPGRGSMPGWMSRWD